MDCGVNDRAYQFIIYIDSMLTLQELPKFTGRVFPLITSSGVTLVGDSAITKEILDLVRGVAKDQAFVV